MRTLYCMDPLPHFAARLAAEAHRTAARRIQWAVAVSILVCTVAVVACSMCTAAAVEDRDRAQERLDRFRRDLKRRGIEIDEE